MCQPIRLSPPLSDEDIENLRIGDRALITGAIYTARDAAHGRLISSLREGRELPIDLEGQVIYYVGPTPARPGQIIGTAGPTTSSRMDPYAPKLLALGLKGMIGKGKRSQEVKEALKKYKAIYFAPLGGAAAPVLISKTIKKCKVVAYEDLGTEAIHEFEVEDFPVIVVNDIYGGDLYEEGRRKYQILKSS
ncbi:MAG: Fe-S-containing hydro-lyase [Actinomycetota bacterium]|nr:Fe-S-containing hydro-lyase [Actinomycetota bacterium]MDI6821643.1 Fe-S-containing hydro-lyase [Actinomycetota bacterium]